MVRWLITPAVLFLCASCAGLDQQASSASIEKERLAACVTTFDVFAGKLKQITNFDAAGNGGYTLGGSTYVPPTILAQPPGTSIQNQFMQAFTRMPLGLRARLCSNEIDFVAVDDNATARPYAFWENDAQKNLAQHNHNWKFIGIPTNFLTSIGTFDSYEEASARDIIAIGNPNATGNSAYAVHFQSVFGNNSSGDTAHTLIAAIAHEMGHIIWNFLSQRSCPDGFDFSSGSWQVASHQPAGFHQFGAVVSGNQHLIANDPFPSDFNGLTPSQTKASVMNLYNNQNFVTLLGAVAPDEDFVEAYKYSVLSRETNGYALAQVTVEYPTDSQFTSVTGHLQSGENARKRACAVTKE